MLRISKLTDYATVILARLAAEPERRFTAAQIAAETHLAAPDGVQAAEAAAPSGTGRVHARLCRRLPAGAAGRPRSPRPRSSMRSTGPVALTECAGSASHCGIERTCRVGHSWQRVNLAIRRSLQEISLLELAGLSHGAEPQLGARSRHHAWCSAVSARAALKREPA